MSNFERLIRILIFIALSIGFWVYYFSREAP